MTTLATIEIPSAPLARMEPSIGSILAAAVDRGMAITDLKELAGLYERELNRKAEQAFNAAVSRFRAECPAILKTKEAAFATKAGGRAGYKFAPLEEVTKVIDPPLSANGLSYRWDAQTIEGMIAVTCFVFHVDGAQPRSSTFTCPISGSSLMSDAQAAAATVTFAKRQSLQMVLGITTDEDNDGRRPNPAPDADPAAPKVATREERQEEPARVTSAMLNELLRTYKAKYPDQKLRFAEWAKTVLESSEPMTAPAMWSPEQFATIAHELKSA